MVVGTPSQYSFEIDSGSFLLELRVTDSSQAIDWDSRNIVVQNGSNDCPLWREWQLWTVSEDHGVDEQGYLHIAL